MTETISRGDNVAGTLTREASAAQPTAVPRPTGCPPYWSEDVR